MAKQHGRTRKGKVITGGHGSYVEGLREFLGVLQGWPEIKTIRLGRITAGRAREVPLARFAGVDDTLDRRRTPRSRRRGDFVFRARRWDYVPNTSRPCGIKCHASSGSMMQEVILSSTDPEALKRRLEKEGMVEDW